MSGTAEEVGHRVVGGGAVGTGGVIGPAYGVAVGLEHKAMAGTELGEGAADDRGSSCSAGSIGGEGTHKYLVGRMGPDGLFYHLSPEKASGKGVSALFQHAPEDEGGGGR